MPDQDSLDKLIEAVQSGPRYRAISVDLVRRIGAQELGKGRSLKDAIKATRSKLHQVGGAYQETPIPYARLAAELETLPASMADPGLQAFCRRVMALHASTRERLPIVESAYGQILAEIGPLRSVLDLACGLNPLALPWLPLAPGAAYFACDIYTDLVDFVGRFLNHTGTPGEARVCDLLQGPPLESVQLALALKTIPCLEQIDKQIGLRLLEGVRAENLLVSFPVQSLGGHAKGMIENYSAHFASLVAGKSWKIRRFDLPGELFFLIRKG